MEIAYPKALGCRRGIPTDKGTHMHLSGLSLRQERSEVSAKEPLEPGHGILGQGTHTVAVCPT